MPLAEWIRPVSGHGNIRLAVLPPNPYDAHFTPPSHGWDNVALHGVARLYRGIATPINP